MGLNTKWARPQVRRRWALKTPSYPVRPMGFSSSSPPLGAGASSPSSELTPHGRTPHAARRTHQRQRHCISRQDEDGGVKGPSLRVSPHATRGHAGLLTRVSGRCVPASRSLVRAPRRASHATVAEASEQPPAPLYSTLLHSTCIL